MQGRSPAFSVLPAAASKLRIVGGLYFYHIMCLARRVGVHSIATTYCQPVGGVHAEVGPSPEEARKEFGSRDAGIVTIFWQDEVAAGFYEYLLVQPRQ